MKELKSERKKEVQINRWVFNWINVFMRFTFGLCVLVFACMHVCTPSTCSTYRGPKRAEESSGYRVTNGGKPPCGCWESKAGPLLEQPLLLTAEPSLQLLPWTGRHSFLHQADLLTYKFQRFNSLSRCVRKQSLLTSWECTDILPK